jgi:predicted nucleic acid-binding protein
MLDRSERRHQECVDVVQNIEGPLVTCEAVVAEACYLLRHVKRAPEAVLENVEQGIFLLPYRLTGRAAKVARLMKKYADCPMDLADACLVDMADELRTSQIFTLDTDFRIYRWGRNRVFDLVIDP